MLINLEEIIFARKIVREYPQAIKNIDICIQLLYNDSQYLDISKSIQQLEESKIMMELTLEAYSSLLKRHGVTSE